METKKIIQSAKKQGICKEWYLDFLKDNSLKNLCAKYFEGSDWAMEHDFPNLEMLRAFKDQSFEFGLLTDFAGEIHIGLDNKSSKNAFFGNSKATIYAGGFSVSEIYVRHNSEVKIEAIENAFMIINVLDNATVQIECTDDAKVQVFDYGGCTIRYDEKANVTVKKSIFT